MPVLPVTVPRRQPPGSLAVTGTTLMNGSPESLALLTVGGARRWCRRRRGRIAARRAVGIGNLEQPPRRDRRGQGDVGRDSIEERARWQRPCWRRRWPDARRPRRVDVGVPHSRVARVGRAVVATCSGVVRGGGRRQRGRPHDRVVDVGVAERMERPLGVGAEQQPGAAVAQAQELGERGFHPVEGSAGSPDIWVAYRVVGHHAWLRAAEAPDRDRGRGCSACQRRCHDLGDVWAAGWEAARS